MIIRLLILLASASMLSPYAVAADAAKGAEAKAAETKAAAPKAPGIKLYDQTMVVARDGSSEVTGKIQLTGVATGTLEVPFAPWGDITDFKLSGAETKGSPNTKAANPRLSLVLPADTPDAVEVQFVFKIAAPKPPSPAKDAKGREEAKAPEPNYRFVSHRFMNGTNLLIERYRLEAWLPAGEVVHTVPEAQPKAAAKDTTPRVRLIGKDGRQGAVLEVGNLRFGSTTSMRLETEAATRSWTLVWIGLVLSLLYLVFFRDIIHKREADGHGREHHTHKEHE